MLNNKEKLAIKYQNKVIESFLKSEYKITPDLISRDKQNHVVIITNIEQKPYRKIIECYMLGFDTIQNKLMLYNVATLTTYEHNPAIEIYSIAVHKAFINNGIGKILMRYVENYAVDHGFESISLESKKTFEDFSENKTTISNIHLLPIKHQTKYLKNNYYDKNLYFYQSLGYKPYGRQDILSYFSPVKKSKLSKIVLEYGLEKPLKKVNKKSLSTSIPKKSTLHPIRYAIDYGYKDYFTYVKNNLPSQHFAPISLDHNTDSLILLVDILNNYQKLGIFGPTQKELNEYHQDFINNYKKYLNQTTNICYFPIENFMPIVDQTIQSNYLLNKKHYSRLLNQYINDRRQLEEDENLNLE